MRGIAAIIPYRIYPYNSGGQKSMALFYQFFSKVNDITLICTSNNSKPRDASYEVKPLLGDSILRYINPLIYFRVKSFIKKNDIDVLIFEQPYFGWLAYLLKNSAKVKIIIRSHNIEGLRFKSLNKWWWKLLWLYEKWVYKMADYTFFIQNNDREYAIRKYGLEANKSAVITSGITWNKRPMQMERETAKKNIQKIYQLTGEEIIILFNGAFDYKPNADALEAIIKIINPALAKSAAFKYRIIICGRDIPQQFIERNFENITLAGFVEDIDGYYKASDIFINPVDDGGGIKTKLVEALGLNITSVSSLNGAIGIDKEMCNGKLLLASDVNDFAAKIIEAHTVETSIGEEYYNHFYWGNIVNKALNIIQQLL